MKTLLKRLVILLVLIGLGVVAWRGAHMLTANNSKNTQYRTETISRGTIANVITATGNISPIETVNVGTQVSGKITKIYAKLNDVVTKDQLLAEIDPSIPETQLRQSKSALETAQLAYSLAQRNYERTKALVAKDYIAKVDLENAWQTVVSSKNSLESAKIQVERDEVNLSYTKVTSPMDGVIIKQEVADGQTLASNFQTPNLFIIAKDMSTMKIDMSVPESDISKIHKGMAVQFSVDAFPDRNFTGEISNVDLNPNNQSGVVTYNVLVSVDNKDRALFPGMTANITILLSEVKDVLRVPSAALRFAPEEQLSAPIFGFLGTQEAGDAPPEATGQGVYLLRGGKLVFVPVTLGATDDFYIEIKSGEVKEGDVVVTGLPVQEE